MTCDSCTLEKQNLTGAIVGGIYGQYCDDCIQAMRRPHHTGAAAYARERDRSANQKDLLQPWDAHGTPNTEFIRQFPEEAQDIFSQKELEEHG